jgi:hypothetical protein
MPAPTPRRRSPRHRILVLSLLAAHAALLLSALPSGSPRAEAVAADRPALPAAPFDDAGYWAFADRQAARLDDLWSDKERAYLAGGGGADTMTNANLLLAHAAAALAGHEGAARNDRRARVLVDRLTATPPFVTKLPPRSRSSQAHANGWVDGLDNADGGNMHLVIETEAIEGLAMAYRARTQLDLPKASSDRIRSVILKAVTGRFWRYPALRLNQFSWYTHVYVAAAEVTGHRELVTRDLRRQLVRFVDGITRPMAGMSIPNTGPGYRFRYLPQSRGTHPMNVDSAEYANIVAGFAGDYETAVKAGMAPLDPARRARVQAWLQRVLTGYWMHNGFLSWDTGFGFERWYQSKKIGLAQRSLIGIATAPSLDPRGGEYGTWAKWIFDRGLALWDRWSVEEGGVPDPVRYGVHVVPQGIGSARLAAARELADAARAVTAGLGRATAKEPPPLYSYDPDIGRLSVTTPTYATAIVAVNQDAFPYGGMDLARLFDGEGDVAGNPGGRPPAAFGVVVRDSSGHRVLATQVGRRSASLGSPPLRLLKAPSGTGRHLSAWPQGHAYAGPFSELVATGVTSARALYVRSTNRFTPGFVETTWSLVRRSGSARYGAEALLPSTGPGARLVAVMTDGTRAPVSASTKLADVDYFHVVSGDSGYVVRVLDAPAGTAVRVVETEHQSSAPRSGPSLSLRFARSWTGRKAVVRVRIATARGAAAAPAAAASTR